MTRAPDLFSLVSRELILGNATIEEQVSFIEEQIEDPFNSGDTNHFKKLSRMTSSQDELDEYCAAFITKIQDTYAKLTIDVSEYEFHLGPLFSSIYKFFIKNISKVMYVFIREFIFNNKNRKVLVSEFMSSKIANYPKEQYGKKEYYILVTKLQAIVDEIFEDDITLKKFINYVTHSTSPVYATKVLDAVEAGIISDSGVVEEMYKMYKKSDSFRSDMNQLEMDINETFITPYLEENGIAGVRIPPTEEIVPDLAAEDEKEESEDDN